MKLEQPIEHRYQDSRFQVSGLKQNADLQSWLLHLSTGRDADCNYGEQIAVAEEASLHLSTGRDADCKLFTTPLKALTDLLHLAM